jgi:SAM-dependent methyltransferase
VRGLRNALTGFTDLFSGHAELYAEARPSYPPSLIAELANLAPGSELAWDSGTGNGQAASLLADHFERVHATDASAEQIAAAKPHARVAFAVEPAERCSLGDGSCDLVLAAQALHWYDLPVFYAKVRRVLRPDGLLAAIGYSWFYVDPDVDAIVSRMLLKPLEPKWAPGNWLLIDGYRSVPFPGEEVRIGPAAIHLAWSREQLETYISSWSAVRSGGSALLRAAFKELASVWPDGQSRHVTMPIVARAARV